MFGFHHLGLDHKKKKIIHLCSGAWFKVMKMQSLTYKQIAEESLLNISASRLQMSFELPTKHLGVQQVSNYTLQFCVSDS